MITNIAMQNGIVKSPHADELSYCVNEHNDIMNHNLSLLNTDQLRIYNIVIETVYDTTMYSKALCFDGPGGAG